jgi:hypothetical protein
MVRVAYLRELCVSSRFESAGEILTNMSVFAFPPRESLISIVNLWFLYGICCVSVDNALMTSPRADKDLLML